MRSRPMTGWAASSAPCSWASHSAGVRTMQIGRPAAFAASSSSKASQVATAAATLAASGGTSKKRHHLAARCG